ncbi:MAG: hypothetical protein ACI85O_001452 [Saprospiraceae bacterium]|jgi:uncharacterized protein YbaP (TraB family)
MKKLIYAIALVFLVSSNAKSQTEVVVAEIREEATDTLENSLLWEITGNDLEKTSYLYGTIHMIAKDDFFVTESTEKAIAETERMTFEINMDEMNNMGMMMSMMMNAFMKDGGSLKELLTEEEYGLVKVKFDEIGLPIALFDKVKPMFTSMMTSMDMSGGNPMEGNGDVVSYEMEFMEKAKTQKMEMQGLETVEYQMSIFDSIPYEVQAQMLVESVQVGEVAAGETDQMAQMVALYKAQNLNGLSELISAEEGGMGDYEDVLLVNRNKNWIPVMSEQMKTKATFFAVGAGHLGGDEGVIRLLRNAGYTVTAMQ